MDMKSEYVMEQKRYSKYDLINKFDLDNEQFINFVKKLKVYGVLKIVDNTSKQKNLSDLTEDDIEIVDIDYNSDYLYVFTFVGILTVGKIVIKCFPKYILSNDEPLEEMKEILKVLNKYGSDEQVINLFNGYDEQKEFNLLHIILFLIWDYNENGIYENQQEIIETNGDGEILWDNTINDTFAIIINNRPFYTELQTKNSIDNYDNYISRLHKFVISDCCQRLKELGLLEIFEIRDINISDDSLDDFGEIHYIQYKLFRELNIQYVTRKQLVLKTLYSYISHRMSFDEDFGLSTYGTNRFNLVWEKACARVFDNKLSTKLKNLKLPVGLNGEYETFKEKTLLEIIKKPIWKHCSSEKRHVADHTLIPDLVSLYEVNNKMLFCIFDAKYYNLILNRDELNNHPGIGDVTKQYLYQLAYNDFIIKHNFSDIKNAFLMPSENENSEIIGKVEMDIFSQLSNSSLEDILVIKLPARYVFKYYLNGKKFKFDDDFVELFDSR